jgi:capsular exopolysaccharide synthesis family protein
LQKQEETAIAMVGNKPDAQIVDRPITGDKPFGSRKAIVFALAAILGLFGAFMYSLAQAIFVTTVQSEMDVLKNTSIPLLGTIPQTKLAKGEVLAIGNDTAGAGSERLRLLRTNLLFELQKQKGQTLLSAKEEAKGHVVMVSSAICGEGKSFVAINLGMTLALGKATVVVVGADLRGQNGSDILKSADNESGLTGFVKGKSKPLQAVKPSGLHDKLFFVYSGTLPSNPAEVLLDEKMTMLMSYLKENFDYIILDTSSVGLVSDALQLQPFADTTLLVVRNNYSKVDHLKIFNNLNEDKKLVHPHIILNDIAIKKEKGYGYEYGYFSKK